jgi:RNA polymerase sigma factor (sigma-70 family)
MIACLPTTIACEIRTEPIKGATARRQGDRAGRPAVARPGPAYVIESPLAAVADLSDGQLLQRFVNRHDPTAFAALVERHRPAVLRVCLRLLEDDHGAEDACQGTFLVLVRKAASIARPERLAGWLYGTALRVAGKARAKARRQRAHAQGGTAAPAPDPLADVMRRELRAVLAAEMGWLPEKFRAPLILCYWEGKTNEEAARQLGCPAGSISWRLARGRELLRQRLLRRARETAWRP